MNITVSPGAKTGSVKIPSSKSQAHRLLICAAFCDHEVTVYCNGISKDIAATIACLNSLGASITQGETGSIRVRPISNVPTGLCHLNCGESGSTLRFLLPIVGTLGADVVFHMDGRLSQRPLEPLISELSSAGMSFRQEDELLYCSGKLSPCRITLPGNISSQYISGLLMALPLLSGPCEIEITGKIESSSYITMTEDVLKTGNIIFTKNDNHYFIQGNQKYSMPDTLYAEGDFSNAAFFLCLGALSPEGVTVNGLNQNSSQGDKAVLKLLADFGADVSCSENAVTVKKNQLRCQTVDASPIPDIIPVLSVIAAAADGDTRFINVGRLRLKESDRLQSTADMLTALGASVRIEGDTLVVNGSDHLLGGTVDPANDHRIAMSAAIAAGICCKPVNISASECVEKSYPDFWKDLNNLKEV